MARALFFAKDSQASLRSAQHWNGRIAEGRGYGSAELFSEDSQVLHESCSTLKRGRTFLLTEACE